MTNSQQTMPVISLMGPTASGKTGTALALAQLVDCEIISVDSALIYRDMNIGTAKPTEAELAQVPHWLIDIKDPTESYSVAEFITDCNAAIENIMGRGKIPVLVGGTMMYFNALVNGLSNLPESDPKLRADIQGRAEQEGWPGLHEYLTKIDPESAARIHPNDPQRLTRAIEVYEISGKTLTWWHCQEKPRCPYTLTQFAIAPDDRAVLHQRIQQRFDEMLAADFVAEVERLFARGDLHEDLPSIRSVGYRQVWQYLQGKYDYTAMRDKGIIATRQLAKRQITWLRGWHELTWLDTFAKDNLTKIIAKAKL